MDEQDLLTRLREAVASDTDIRTGEPVGTRHLAEDEIWHGLHIDEVGNAFGNLAYRAVRRRIALQRPAPAISFPSGTGPTADYPRRGTSGLRRLQPEGAQFTPDQSHPLKPLYDLIRPAPSGFQDRRTFPGPPAGNQSSYDLSAEPSWLREAREALDDPLDELRNTRIPTTPRTGPR